MRQLFSLRDCCRFGGAGLIFVLLAGCAAVTPAPVREASPDVPVEKPEPAVRRPDTHTIRAGETLAGIALEYGLDYQELALWNGIGNPNLIHGGDTLRLSPPAQTPVSSAVVRQAQTAPAPVLSPQSGGGVPTISPQNNAAAIVPVVPVAPSVPALPDARKPAAARDAPIKDGPVATKHAYNERTLKNLRAAHSAQTGATGVQDASFTPPVSAPTAAIAAPKNTRKRFNVEWSWPTTGKITGKFSDASKGVDISGAKGDPVRAVADGKVVYTGSGVKSYGRLVILKHDNDYLSAYAHSDKILVKEGQQIARGEQIATVGDSGATKPMLHLEIRKSGQPVDPLQVLPPKP